MENFSRGCVTRTVRIMYIILVSHRWEVSISDAVVQSQAYPIFDTSWLCMDDPNFVVIPVDIPSFIITAEARRHRCLETTAIAGMS